MLLVSGILAESTVRAGAMIVNVRMFFYSSWEDTFIDVSSREVGLAEVRGLVRIIQFEVQRFCYLVIFVISSYCRDISVVILVSGSKGHT